MWSHWLRFIAREIVVESAKENGVKLYWVDDFHIESSDIYGEHVAVFVVGGRRGTIAHNALTAMQFADVQVVDGSTDILIQSNVFGSSAGRKLYVGGKDTLFLRPPSVYQAERVHIIGNVFSGNGFPEIVVSDSLDTTIAHNTFIDPRTSIFSILHENAMPAGGVRGLTYEANLFWFDSRNVASYVDVFGTTNELDTVTWRENLWWAHDDPQFAGATLPPPLVEQTRILGIDPLITANGKLLSGSPAIGKAAGAPMLRDVDGECVKSPSTPGADEP